MDHLVGCQSLLMVSTVAYSSFQREMLELVQSPAVAAERSSEAFQIMVIVRRLGLKGYQ